MGTCACSAYVGFSSFQFDGRHNKALLHSYRCRYSGRMWEGLTERVGKRRLLPVSMPDGGRGDWSATALRCVSRCRVASVYSVLDGFVCSCCHEWTGASGDIWRLQVGVARESYVTFAAGFAGVGFCICSRA